MSDLSIGIRIRDARTRRGLTQQQLADVLGVALRTVGNWERGITVPRNKRPHLESVLKVSLGGTAHIGEVRSDDETLQVFYAKYGATSDADQLEALSRAVADKLRRTTGSSASSASSPPPPAVAAQAVQADGDDDVVTGRPQSDPAAGGGGFPRAGLAANEATEAAVEDALEQLRVFRRGATRL